jgi:hypothetical protein
MKPSFVSEKSKFCAKSTVRYCLQKPSEKMYYCVVITYFSYFKLCYLNGRRCKHCV